MTKWKNGRKIIEKKGRHTRKKDRKSTKRIKKMKKYRKESKKAITRKKEYHKVY